MDKTKPRMVCPSGDWSLTHRDNLGLKKSKNQVYKETPPLPMSMSQNNGLPTGSQILEVHILAKNPFKKKNSSFPMPCFLHLAWGSCELLLGGTEEVSTCRAAQKCHRENLKTCDKCHHSHDNPLFETILVIYPSICTAQSLGKNGGAHCRCMRCLAVTGTSPRDPILRLNIPILLKFV